MKMISCQLVKNKICPSKLQNKINYEILSMVDIINNTLNIINDRLITVNTKCQYWYFDGFHWLPFSPSIEIHENWSCKQGKCSRITLPRLRTWADGGGEPEWN